MTDGIPGRPERGQSSDEAEQDDALTDYLAGALCELEAAREDVPGVVAYGASNYPHDPTVWAADWRAGLPPNDPRRNESDHPVVRNGSLDAYKTMKAAQEAVRRSMGRSPNPPPPH